MTTETVIVGDGPAAWIMALTLARQAPARVTVIAHPSPDDVDPFGPALTAPPAIRARHARAGLSEADVMGIAVPLFGLSLEGWGDGPAFIPSGQTGADAFSVAFHQQLARLGRLESLADYSLSAQVARQRRYAPPSRDPASFLSTLDHALSLDAAAYTTLLRRHALKARVTLIEGAVAAVERAPSGAIAAVTLTDGARVAGDLFIDASGPAAVLTGAPFQSWSDDIPFDRLHVETNSGAEPALQLGFRATDDSIERSAPLPGRRVTARLTRGGDGPPFQPGRRERFWDRNVIAVGTAAQVLPPLSAGALHLIHRAAYHLPRLWPATPDHAVEAREFNRLMAAEVEADRDFALMMLRGQGAVLTEAAAHRLALFEGRGRVSRREHEPFTPGFIAAALLASGARPRRIDPLAEALDPDILTARADRIRDLAARTAATLPPWSPVP